VPSCLSYLYPLSTCSIACRIVLTSYHPHCRGNGYCCYVVSVLRDKQLLKAEADPKGGGGGRHAPQTMDEKLKLSCRAHMLVLVGL